MTNRVRSWGISTTVALAYSAVVTAATINVPADQPTIQAGINAAGNGDEVLVAPGTYNEIIDLAGKAITLRSSGGADVTTIDATGVPDPGDGLPVVRIDNGEGADTIIEGFTITGGTGDTGAFGLQVGGGIYFGTGVEAIVRQCIIQSNAVDPLSGGVGGGIFTNDASPSFEECQFLMNTALGNGGGGAYLFEGGSVSFLDCRFESNQAVQGGAIAVDGSEIAIQMMGCDFIGNVAEGNGAAAGAIFAQGSIHISRCRFLGNTASATGAGSPSAIGGSMVITSIESMEIDNCLFAGNAADEGAAIILNLNPQHVGSITNCTIVGNVANDATGGIFGFDPESVTIDNCIVWGNTANGAMDSAAQIDAVSDLPSVNSSIVQGGWIGPGANNLDLDPLLVDLDGADDVQGTDDDDARLLAGSPAIDAGNTGAIAGLGITIDLAGNPRVVDDPATANTGVEVGGLTIDIGAYEFGAEVTALGACCINSSCVQLSEVDCLAVGGTFGGVGSSCGEIMCFVLCPGDLDGDQDVDQSDLGILLANFGCMPPKKK